ncbi:MAG TPA: transglycosylase domain-containing protein [Acidimicrobiales bacterium]|nr:transglycosylase domain-containing protein [Acidimicrobiales bacterium]
MILLGAAAGSAGLYELTRIPLPAAHALAQTTFVYDSTGHPLATFSEQNRVDVKLSQVAPVVIQAVVSTEDRHFFTEGALNPVSMARALLSDVAGSGNLQGASTITQQYVKQTYLNSQRTITRKVKEAALAIRLSRTESKQQILQGYLNTIYWGRGAYGIEAAAETYFGVDAAHVDLPEAALLAGMIRDPYTADPTKDPAVAHQHQHDSLQAMVRDAKITAGQAAAAEAVHFSSFVRPPSTASASHAALPAGEDYFVEAVREQLIAKYGQAEVDGGGLRVTTTLDPTLQTEAYNSVYGHNTDALDPAAGQPSGSLVSIDDSGQVRALVGGQDFRRSSVDLALGTAGGGGGRQPGSTFKAFMLAELLKLGYSPLSVLPSPPEVVVPHGNADGTPWPVKNFEGEATQPQMNVVDATARSINTVYAQIVDKIGSSNLDAMAAELGINRSELGNHLSEVLGTDEVSPLEMAAAYATFAAGGVYHAPLLITRVTDAAGRSMPLPVTPTSRAVLSAAQDAEETYVLEQVVLRGTGTAAGGIGSAVAGKTGTTDNSANAWFIGYTPNLTTAVWMGYASQYKPMVDFRGLSSVQGGTVPAQLWHNFMAAAVHSQPQWAGSFPPVYSLAGRTLTPPAPSSLEFPLGMGTTTTTTTVAPTTTTSTTVAGAGSGGSGTSPTATSSPPTTTPSTTPPATSPPTTTGTTPTTRAAPPSTTATGAAPSG